MDFNELTNRVRNAQLGTSRVTDMVPGSYVVNTKSDDPDRVQLVNKETNVPYTMGINAFAAMRIVEKAEDATSIATTKDARENEKVSNLKAAILAEKVTLSENTTFDVVHRTKIYDTVAEEIVYRNDNYKGYPEYVKAARAAAALPSTTPDEIAARNLAFSEASDALRASGVKDKTDAKALLMPIFVVKS